MGMCSAFMVYAPLVQWCGVRVTGQRTAQHWAQIVKRLCDEVYPQAGQIVLVQDNLNTHTPALLYEAFTPQEATIASRRLTAPTPAGQPSAGHLVPRFAPARKLVEHGGDRDRRGAGAMPPTAEPTGSSPPRMLAPSSSAFTPRLY